MDISVIIVSYNSSKFLKICIESIFAYSGSQRIEVLLIDNNSHDNSTEIVKSLFPDVKIIRNKINFGYAKAVNIGIANSSGDFICILNPDTALSEGALTKLSSFLSSHPEAGTVAPKLLYPDGSLQLSCRMFYNLRTIILRRSFLGTLFTNSKIIKAHLMLNSNHNNTLEVDWVLGACMMFPKRIFEIVGYFDESYKLYFEDVDFCYRIKQLNYKVFYYPQAVVFHNHQRDSAKGLSQKTLFHAKSMLHFFNKFGWRF